MMRPLFNDDSAGAQFSDDGIYRFRLWRKWSSKPRACFCMLNPSTGNETVLDPTLQRCIGFARKWGCGGIDVVNLFAIVSPDPSILRTHPDPVGPGNDEHILDVGIQAKLVVFGWGAFPMAAARAREVASLLAASGVTPWCLGVTKAGQPRHPLYVSGDTTLVPWEAPKA